MARVSKQDWCVAALLALGRGGVADLAVEPLARELGVTKGSFYHHFKNRDALIEAALHVWKDLGTVAVIDLMDRTDGPRERLAALLAHSLDDLDQLRAEAGLMAAAVAGHPVIGPAYQEVTQMRLGYLIRIYQDIGVEDAERWATLALASYLGGVQLSALQPSPLRPADVPAYIAHLQAILTPDEPS